MYDLLAHNRLSMQFHTELLEACDWDESRLEAVLQRVSLLLETLRVPDLPCPLEFYLEKKANINFIKRQKADMLETYADIKMLKKIDPSFKSTEFKEGIKKFILWFKEYHKNDFNF